MNKQAGFSLFEVLLSIFLASLITLSLMQLYLSSKREYLTTQKLLESSLDLLWVRDLLSDSIRRAGFTPCLGIDQLKVRDTRGKLAPKMAGLVLTSAPQQSLQVYRMSEFFTPVLAIQNSSHLILNEGHLLKTNRLLLLANCEEAEIHKIRSLHKSAQGYLLTLVHPTHFSTTASLYAGEWFEEKWFIKPNAKKENSLYYQLDHAEELSTLVHSLQIKIKTEHQKKLVQVTMGLDQNKTQEFLVAVRGS